MFTNPWAQTPPPPPQPKIPREVFLERLRGGVPIELAERAMGVGVQAHPDRETDMALAEGEILLFERARDSGVTGVIRAAMRQEVKTWLPKAEPAPTGGTLEELLRD